MIQIQNKVDCCGCNACGDVCAHQAITFKTDNEGFWYPEVDKVKCTDCHLCEKVCPIINIKDLKKNDLPQSICYAAEHKNLEVVFDSTSGGLFSALADIMYKSDGYVGGAIFNDDFKSVRQFISNDKKDLPKLRSSKYLQSSLEGFYRQVRDLVKAGKNVLVCGSPCQMAALRAFLRKDYDNLILADFICRGTNSPKVWCKYIDSFEERYGHKVVYAKAKSKEYGWRNLTQKVILDDGKAYFETKDQNNYTIGYLKTNAYCRPACYECKFKGFPRIADITLADFWGIEKIDPNIEKDLGTSLVMINSRKGKAFFEEVKKRINYLEMPFEKSIAGNFALKRSLPLTKIDRKAFFEDIDKMSFVELAKKYNFDNVRHKGVRQKVKSFLKVLLIIIHNTQLYPTTLYQFFKYNSPSEIIHGNIMIPTPYTIINLQKGGKIKKAGISIIGFKRIKKSKVETRIIVEKGATLFLGPNTRLMYGADIEVFKGARLVWKGEGGCNINGTVICGNYIEIGKGVMMGRNVTIRDNNGGHYLNRNGYRNTRPVFIGDKAWLCEQSTIMPGVKIGDGAIVGACSFVIGKVPSNAMVSGNPAKIVDTNVLWKY